MLKYILCVGVRVRACLHACMLEFNSEILYENDNKMRMSRVRFPVGPIYGMNLSKLVLIRMVRLNAPKPRSYFCISFDTHSTRISLVWYQVIGLVVRLIIINSKYIIPNMLIYYVIDTEFINMYWKVQFII